MFGVKPMTALFPGSFDPVTLGHMDIIKRASGIFDKLIVAVLNNPSKKTVFSVDERLKFLSLSAGELPNVEISEFSGLLTDFFVISNSSVIIRGLRNVSEYEHELQYALAYTTMDKKIETLFMPSSPEHIFISSGMVKETASFGGNLGLLVPDVIINKIKEKFYGKV